MFEVFSRSQRGRICMLSVPEGNLRCPAILGPDGDFPISVEDGARVLRIGGAEVKLDGKISKTYSAGPFEPVIDGSTALVRLPIKEGAVKPKEVEAVVITNAFELRTDPRRAVEALIAARKYAGYGSLLIAPGLADASNLALFTYMGVDAFDYSVPESMARNGTLGLPTGPMVSDLASLERNKEEMDRELEVVMRYIESGRLRELADQRATASTWNVALLRIFDSVGYGYQEEACSVSDVRFRCNTTQSLKRPEVERYRRKFLADYKKPVHKRILLLLPCSARKPYHKSKSHRAYSSAIHTASHDSLVHEVIVTSPLGVVPRELDVFYPASAYDIPVTGEWKCQEREMIRSMVAHLLSQGYDKVISHLGEDTSLVEGLCDLEETAVRGQVSRESLDALDMALRNAAKGMDKVGYDVDRLESVRSILSFQFDSTVADALLDGADVRGKYPYWKVHQGKDQVCMMSAERGMFSMTLNGAEVLSEMGVKKVEAGDFELRGSLFAVGVTDSDPSIRIGEEVTVVSGGKTVATGVAAMSGPEMVNLDRGVAVKIRHKA